MNKNDKTTSIGQVLITGQGKLIQEETKEIINLSEELRQLEYQYYKKGYDAIDVQILAINLKREFNIDEDYKIALEDLLDLVGILKETDEETLNHIIEESGIKSKTLLSFTDSIEDLSKFELGYNRAFRRNPLKAIEKESGMNLIDYKPWNRTKHGYLKNNYNNHNFVKKNRRKR